MQPFAGETRCFGFGKNPSGCLASNGQTTEYQALYSLLGTQFGGTGVTNFALPDLRGKLPVHYNPGDGVNVASKGGAETVALTAAQLLNHTHALMASSAGATTGAASGAYLAPMVNSTGAPQQDTHSLPSGATVAKPFTLNTTSVVSAGGNAGQNWSATIGPTPPSKPSSPASCRYKRSNTAPIIPA
jgi:microcystin-dependent protein